MLDFLKENIVGQSKKTSVRNENQENQNYLNVCKSIKMPKILKIKETLLKNQKILMEKWIFNNKL